jgi:ribosome recycling factor
VAANSGTPADPVLWRSAVAYFDAKSYEKRMGDTLAACRQELGGLRTGRASPHLLDGVAVEAHGVRTPLKALAGVSTPEPRTIAVQVWDPSMVRSVEKAIRDSGLGLNPVVAGQTVRVKLPPLTEARRQELAKAARRIAEQHRVAVRQIRQDANNTLKRMAKAGEIAEHVQNSLSKRLQEMTDRHVEQIDEAASRKEAEILAV